MEKSCFEHVEILIISFKMDVMAWVICEQVLIKLFQAKSLLIFLFPFSLLFSSLFFNLAGLMSVKVSCHTYNRLVIN